MTLKFFLCFLIVPILHAIPLDILPQVDPATAYTRTTAGIEVYAHYFTGLDCKNYFGSDLVQQGYRPIYLQITNKTKEMYVLEPATFRQLFLLPTEDVFKLLGFNIWAYMSLVGLSTWSWEPYALPVAVALPVYFFHRYNQRLRANIHDKVINPQRQIIIRPGETVARVAFCVERLFGSIFSFVLNDESMAKTVEFSVDLLQAKRKQTNNPMMPWLMVA